MDLPRIVQFVGCEVNVPFSVSEKKNSWIFVAPHDNGKDERGRYTDESAKREHSSRHSETQMGKPWLGGSAWLRNFNFLMKKVPYVRSHSLVLPSVVIRLAPESDASRSPQFIKQAKTISK